MPLNAIEEHRYQLAILFGQLVVKNKAKYSAFSVAFLRQQFHELLGYPAHYIRSNEDIRDAVNLWCEDRVAAEERYGPIGEWKTHKVTNMSRLFHYKEDFNDDISCWNVASVTNMSSMFSGASSFNQPLEGLDTSSVTDMTSMFYFVNVTFFLQ